MTVSRESFDVQLPVGNKEIPVQFEYQGENSFAIMLGDHCVGEIDINKEGYACVDVGLVWVLQSKDRGAIPYSDFNDAVLHALWCIKTYTERIQKGCKDVDIRWEVDREREGFQRVEYLLYGKVRVGQVYQEKNGAVGGNPEVVPNKDCDLRIHASDKIDGAFSKMQEAVKNAAVLHLVEMGILN